MPSLCLLRSNVAAWEPNLRRYRVQLRVTMDSKLDGPGMVLQYLASQEFRVGISTYNLQPLGASVSEADDFATLKNIGAPRRAANDTSKLMWIVDLEYEFELENYPPLRPYKVEPFYIEDTSPIEATSYLGAFNRVSGSWVPKALTNATYTEDRTYPIGNSSGVPVLPAPERPLLRPAYRVSWLKATALDASFYANTWNAGIFTLSSFSRVFNTPTAKVEQQRFLKSFAPLTLRLASVQQPLRTIYGIDWYEITLEFIEEEYHLYELDRGLTARVKVGDPDGKGGTISVGDLPEGGPGQRDILDWQGQPISDPVLLNGEGKPLQEQSLSLPAVYLRWAKGDRTFFDELQIGAWQ